MAFVRSYAFTSTDTNSTSFQADLPVGYQTGDLLIFIAVHDQTTGDGPTTPSGWTLEQGPDAVRACRSAIFSKHNVTAGSETAPTTTSTNSDTWTGIVLAIGGVATSGAVESVGFQDLVAGSRNELTFVSDTTITNNCLVLHAFANSGLNGTITGTKILPISLEPGYAGESLYLFKETVPTAGNTSSGIAYQAGNTNHHYYSIIIADGSSGSEVEPHQTAGGLMNDLNTFTAAETASWLPSGFPSGITTDAFGTYGAINGVPGATADRYQEAGDKNVIPFLNAASSRGDRGTYQGLRFEVDRTGGGATVDLSTSTLVGCMMMDIYKAIFQLGLKDTLGLGVVLEDSLGNWSCWCVNGSDSNRTFITPDDGPFIIDPSTTPLDSSGTLDTTDIKYMAFILNAASANNLNFFISNIMEYQPIEISGGSTGVPLDYERLYNYGLGNNHRFYKSLGSSSQLVGAWHIGDGSTSTYCAITDRSIRFPDLNSNGGCHVPSGYFGFRFRQSSGAISFTDCSVTCSSGFTWKWDESGGGTYTGNILTRAKPFTVGTGDYTDCTFIGCATVSQGSATFDNVDINGSADGKGMIWGAGSSTNLTVRNCTTGIEFPTAGTHNISDITFSGNTTDIEFSGTGTLTLRIANGVATPTTATTGGGSISIVTIPRTITFENLTSANVQIVEDDNVTVASRQTSQTGTYVFTPADGSTGTWCYVINREGYEPITGSFNALGADFSVDCTQTQKLQSDGSPMYAGTTSAFLSVTTQADGSRMNLRIGDGSVGIQAIFDEVEDALMTQDGMTYLCNGGGEVSISSRPTGRFVDMGTNVRVIRDNAGDSNATISAFVESTDGVVLDGTNGPVQFVTPNSDVNVVSVTGTNVADINDFKATTASLQFLEVDIKKVNGLTVDGTGTEADPWGPA